MLETTGELALPPVEPNPARQWIMFSAIGRETGFKFGIKFGRWKRLCKTSRPRREIVDSVVLNHRAWSDHLVQVFTNEIVPRFIVNLTVIVLLFFTFWFMSKRWG